ncbi:TPA: DNA-binding protein [Candidatus Poribacteria bacterium]|nr:DNA-binding protein [Candidatus Poribacteria bacterium]
MKPKVYIETTIISYLAARQSKDIITAAKQQISCEWWEKHRSKYEIFISQLVIQESSAGDPDVVRRRLDILEGFSLLDITEEAIVLSKELLENIPLPRKAELDVLHIAIATVNGMDYLVTWNFTHIANATLRQKIETICRSLGYEPPVICTLCELMEA